MEYTKSYWLENREKKRKEKIKKFIDICAVMVLLLMFASLLIAMCNYSQYTLIMSLQ